jgi:hypothetical protein
MPTYFVFESAQHVSAHFCVLVEGSYGSVILNVAEMWKMLNLLQTPMKVAAHLMDPVATEAMEASALRRAKKTAVPNLA